VLVSGLTVGDYLLWNWSLNGNHEVLALVAGLTLPPLAVACVWLLVLSAARLVAGLARRSPASRSPARRSAARRSAAHNATHRRSRVTGHGRARPERARTAQASAAAPEEVRSSAGSPDPPSRTLAA